MKFLKSNNIDNRFIIFIITIISLVLFALIKYFSIVYTDIASIYILLAILLLVSIFSSGLKYQYTSASFKTLTVGLSAISAFYIFTSYPTYIEYVSADYRHHAQYLFYGRWVALTCAIAALFRPTFILFPMLFIFQSKHFAYMFTGIPITGTDYLPVIEIGMLLGIISFVYSLALKYPNLNISKYTFKYKNIHYFDLVVILCVSIHFGNYFYSGIYKLLLDGEITSWVLTNKTYYLLLNAYTSGNLPISHYQDLFKYIYEFYRNNYIFSNLFIVTTQLISLLILYRIRWACALIILYDIIHLIIFVTTGIFFWKWILLNILLVVSLSRINLKVLPLSIFLLAIICTLSARTLFFTAKLAWYDTPALNDAYFVAISKDGKEYRVPSNYFLDSSVTYAQQRAGWPYIGYFPTKTFGTTFTKLIKNNAERCNFINSSDIDHSLNLEMLKKHVTNHHAYILNHIDGNGLLNYDMYPHHIWSNPKEFSSFYNLNKRNINSYKFIVNSICNSYKDGEVQSKLVKTSEYIIMLKK